MALSPLCAPHISFLTSFLSSPLSERTRQRLSERIKEQASGLLPSPFFVRVHLILLDHQTGLCQCIDCIIMLLHFSCHAGLTGFFFASLCMYVIFQQRHFQKNQEGLWSHVLHILRLLMLWLAHSALLWKSKYWLELERPSFTVTKHIDVCGALISPRSDIIGSPIAKRLEAARTCPKVTGK